MTTIGGPGGFTPPHHVDAAGEAGPASEAAPLHAPAAPPPAGPSMFERAGPSRGGVEVSATARATDEHGLPAPHPGAHEGWAGGAAAAGALAGPRLEALVERLEAAVDAGADLAQVFAAALAEGLPAEVVALLEGSLAGLLQPESREALVVALAPFAEGGAAKAAEAPAAKTGAGEASAREGAAARGAGGAAKAAPAGAPSAAKEAGATKGAPPPDRKEVAAALGDAARAIASGAARPAAAAAPLRALDRLIERDPAAATGVIQVVVGAGGAAGPRDATEGDEAGGGDGGGKEASTGSRSGLDAIRSLDHAGAKAIALDRASLRMADLRKRLRGDPDAAADLERTRASAAALLASAPVAIAAFARARPELLPPPSTQRVMAEILRAGGADVEASLEATFAAALAPAPPNKTGARAFALGYLGGAAIAAAGEIGDARAARRLAAALGSEDCRGALEDAVRGAPGPVLAAFEEGLETFL